MVGGGIHKRRIIGEDAGLEVAVVVAFHADVSTSEVGGTYVGGGAVEYHYLEMHSRTESPFQPAPQLRIFVEILAEVLTRLFGVQQQEPREIVVPVFEGDEVMAVLDIDSRELATFDDTDRQYLERLVKRQGVSRGTVGEW